LKNNETRREDSVPEPDGFELHLQEGFTGETVEIGLDGVPLASVVARTRMQTGLAHVEHLAARPGQLLTVTIPARRLAARLVLASGQGFACARLDAGGLSLAHPTEPPRYL
jgi:hypothetical protein